MKNIISHISTFSILALLISLFIHGCADKEELEPWQDENYRPDVIKVDFTIYPETGPVNMIFAFDASNCEVIEDPSIQLGYYWDWEGDGVYDSATIDPMINHSYSIAGSYNVKLKAMAVGGHLYNIGSKNVTVSPASGEILPMVTTGEVSDITLSTATCGGAVTHEGNYPVIRKGVCWNLTGNPTAYDSTTNDGNGAGAFVSSMAYLYADTVYYVRAYATSVAGTGYGEQISFRTEPIGGDPCPGMPTVEWQGQTYNTVKIGDQCWLRQNLNWETGNSWCYDDHPGNCDAYGRLYDWETIMSGEGSSTAVPSGVQGICPDGWHLPSDNEWKILEGVVDSQYPVGVHMWDTEGTRGYDAGKILKEKWNWAGNSNSTDLYNFSAKGAGKYDNGSFHDLREQAYFWTSTQSSGTSAYYRSFAFISDQSYRYSELKEKGYSVRCIKD